MEDSLNDEPSAQLCAELQQSVITSLTLRRPILHHLNSDSSWLLQIPRPRLSVQFSGRHWFNILIDPWLSGSQSDVAPWFSEQWHATPPAVGSVTAVEELARRIEALSVYAVDTETTTRSRRTSRKKSITPPDQLETLIDAIAISHEFTDHCHKETLLQCNRDIPVFATSKAASLIGGWGHFRYIIDTPTFPPSGPGDWRCTSIPPLPEWMGIGRLLSRTDSLYYHSALMITFKKEVDGEDPKRRWSDSELFQDDAVAEAVIYTPHGIHAPDLRVVMTATPPIETLAFLHGLHDVAIPKQQLNLGGHNGLQAQRLLQAKYWIGTHDAQKIGGGIVSWVLKRKIISLEDALKEEREERAKKDELYGKWKDENRMHETIPTFLELENGESVVLR